MKICFLTPTLELHGGILVMLKYAGHLASRGYDVTVIAPQSAVECTIPDGVKILSYKRRPSRLAHYSCQLVYIWQIAILLQSGFDVVVPIYTPLAVHAVFARWRRRLNFRVILLYQDFFEMLWVGRYIKFILARNWFVSNLDTVIAVSEGIASEFQKISKRLPAVIANGIDEVFFADQNAVKEKYVLFVGRPVESKGFNVFEKAMGLVVKSIPDVKGVLVSSAVEDGMIGAIQTVRYVDRIHLKKLYAEALVYVHAAVGESFGLPPLEAMASGTATVVTRTVGTDDYSRDNHNCLATDYGDYQALAQNIIRLIRDENLRLRLEKEGRLTALSYQWANSLRRFEQEVVRITPNRDQVHESLVGAGHTKANR
jgi:glycosyltransferase involved in cell wall biosynthesis